MPTSQKQQPELPLTGLVRLTGYDEEARYFDAGVSSAQRQDLEGRVMAVLHPAFAQQAQHVKAAALAKGQALLEQALSQPSFAEAAQRYASWLTFKGVCGARRPAMTRSSTCWRCFDV